jgi:hypothetical protein
MGRFHWANSLLDGKSWWLVRTAVVVPDNEHWLHQPVAASDMAKAMGFATTHTPSDESVDTTLDALSRGE